nr:hypothetical protein Itr_chr03CG09520 [Ipomoea trifida]
MVFGKSFVRTVGHELYDEDDELELEVEAGDELPLVLVGWASLVRAVGVAVGANCVLVGSEEKEAAGVLVGGGGRAKRDLNSSCGAVVD